MYMYLCLFVLIVGIPLSVVTRRCGLVFATPQPGEHKARLHAGMRHDAICGVITLVVVAAAGLVAFFVY